MRSNVRTQELVVVDVSSGSEVRYGSNRPTSWSVTAEGDGVRLTWETFDTVIPGQRVAITFSFVDVSELLADNVFDD